LRDHKDIIEGECGWNSSLCEGGFIDGGFLPEGNDLLSELAGLFAD